MSEAFPRRFMKKKFYVINVQIKLNIRSNERHFN